LYIKRESDGENVDNNDDIVDIIW